MKIDFKDIYSKNSNYIPSINMIKKKESFKLSMDKKINKLSDSGYSIFKNAPDNVRKSWNNVVNSLPKEDRFYAGITMLNLNLSKSEPIDINSFNYTDLCNLLMKDIKNSESLSSVDEVTRITHSKELYILNKFKDELTKYNL